MSSARHTRPGPEARPTPGPGSIARTSTACGRPSDRGNEMRQGGIPYGRDTWGPAAAPIHARGARRAAPAHGIRRQVIRSEVSLDLDEPAIQPDTGDFPNQE